jgi:magnesium chelatase family protein
MSLARSFGAVVNGVEGQIVVVEVDHSRGLPGVGLVGLPDTSVNEAKHRARTAIGNQKLLWPKGRITISLSPAEVRKHGAGLDLAIAVGVLGATNQISQCAMERTVFIGELGLDGSIRPIPGALSATIAAAKAGFERVVVPRANNVQCSVVPEIQVISFVDLNHLIEGLDKGKMPVVIDSVPVQPRGSTLDLVDVLGQSQARWALEIAAVGRHNMLMVGAPGVGKTLLAERLPGILPSLTPHQSLESTSIHLIAGTLVGDGSITTPPFEAPHHSSSVSAFIGSVHGHRVHPGALTRAHHGVLFLDEAPEFPRNALEALRQPLESGRIPLNRSHWTGALPARFQLLMAANPCPCGNNSPDTKAECTCSSMARRSYAQRISGPLADRLDLKIAMPNIPSREVGDSSEVVAARVKEARSKARNRFKDQGWHVNSEIPPSFLRGIYVPSIGGQELLDDLHRKSGRLRGVHRILRVAWSIADLSGHDRPTRDDVGAAIHLREQTGAFAA